MGSRTWIKVHCDKWLEGTLRQETPEIRSVWIDLLVLAGSGQYGDTGQVRLTNGVGFSDRQVAEILNIPLRLWRRAKVRFVETDRIEVTTRGAIHIVNWSKYQSEYERQKPYRDRQSPRSNRQTEYSGLEPKVSLDNPSKEIEREKEIEKESDNEKLLREVTIQGYRSNPLDPSPLGDSTPPPLASQRIVDYLKANGKCTADRVSDALGIPINTVRVYLSSLKKQGLVGNPRRGIWTVCHV